MRGSAVQTEDGSWTVALALDDDNGNLLTLSALVGSRERAESVVRRFKARPEIVYQNLLTLLTREEGEES